MSAGPTEAFSVVLLVTSVASWSWLITKTDDATKWLPLAFSANVACTSENGTEAGLMAVMTGAGRALPHNGLSELHPGSMATTRKSNNNEHAGLRDVINHPWIFCRRIEPSRPPVMADAGPEISHSMILELLRVKSPVFGGMTFVTCLPCFLLNPRSPVVILSPKAWAKTVLKTRSQSNRLWLGGLAALLLWAGVRAWAQDPQDTKLLVL